MGTISSVLRSLFWLATGVAVGLIVLNVTLGFAERRFKGNIVGKAASTVGRAAQVPTNG